MKKIFGISLIAVLSVSPLLAHAEDTAPSTTLNATTANALPANGTNVIIAGEPYYAGKTITDADRASAASAAYVKGAYNDAIAAVNKIHVEASGLAAQITSALAGFSNVSLSNINATGQANISAKGTVDLTKNNYDANTVGKAIVDINNNVNNLGNTYATKTQVTANIDAATASKTGVSLAVSGNVSGTANGYVPVMVNWGDSTANTTTVALSGGTMSGTISNGATATGDITGIDVAAPTTYATGL